MVETVRMTGPKQLILKKREGYKSEMLREDFVS
jgi:hypothetical protein